MRLTRLRACAQAALHGVEDAGSLGWLEVKLVKAEVLSGGQGGGGVTAYVWLEHRELPLVQGPFRSACRRSLADAVSTPEWGERVQFAWAAVHGKAPSVLRLRLVDAQARVLGDTLVPVSLGLPASGARDVHVGFGAGDTERAVALHHEKGTARDIVRPFPLELLEAEAAGTGARGLAGTVTLQLCFRLAMSVESFFLLAAGVAGQAGSGVEAGRRGERETVVAKSQGWKPDMRLTEAELRRVFDTLDMDRDGKAPHAEFVKALRKHPKVENLVGGNTDGIQVACKRRVCGPDR